MNEHFSKTGRADFYGFQSIDSSGRLRNHVWVVRGLGDMTLTDQEIHYKQRITKKEYRIPLKDIFKLELQYSHNLKMSFPGKILRIHFKENGETKIFGARMGGSFSFKNGWHDYSVDWMKAIQNQLKK